MIRLHVCRPTMLAAITTLLVSCRSSHESPAVVAIDLVQEFSRAECRPAGACTIVPGTPPAIRLPAPGRITWVLPLPHDGRLRTTVGAAPGAAVRFRVGISDDRIYDALSDITATGRDGPRPLDIDISAYAGLKWSLFYHPDRIAWHVIFSADAVHGTPGVALWELPQIVTPRRAAREYLERRRRMEPPR